MRRLATAAGTASAAGPVVVMAAVIAAADPGVLGAVAVPLILAGFAAVGCAAALTDGLFGYRSASG